MVKILDNNTEKQHIKASPETVEKDLDYWLEKNALPRNAIKFQMALCKNAIVKNVEKGISYSEIWKGLKETNHLSCSLKTFVRYAKQFTSTPKSLVYKKLKNEEEQKASSFQKEEEKNKASFSEKPETKKKKFSFSQSPNPDTLY